MSFGESFAAVFGQVHRSMSNNAELAMKREEAEREREMRSALGDFLASPQGARTAGVTPQAQQAPQAPQTPQTPQTPQAQQAPQTPQAPQASQAPQATQTPQAHGGDVERLLQQARTPGGAIPAAIELSRTVPADRPSNIQELTAGVNTLIAQTGGTAAGYDELYRRTLERVARAGGAQAAAQALSFLENLRTSGLNFAVQLGLSALEAGDWQGLQAALNRGTMLLPDGHNRRFEVTATGQVIMTTTPENGGPPQRVVLDRERARNALLMMRDPRWTMEYLLNESRHRLEQAKFSNEVANQRRQQAGYGALADIFAGSTDPERVRTAISNLGPSAVNAIGNIQDRAAANQAREAISQYIVSAANADPFAPMPPMPPELLSAVAADPRMANQLFAAIQSARLDRLNSQIESTTDPSVRAALIRQRDVLRARATNAAPRPFTQQEFDSFVNGLPPSFDVGQNKANLQALASALSSVEIMFPNQDGRLLPGGYLPGPVALATAYGILSGQLQAELRQMPNGQVDAVVLHRGTPQEVIIPFTAQMRSVMQSMFRESQPATQPQRQGQTRRQGPPTPPRSTQPAQPDEQRR